MRFAACMALNMTCAHVVHGRLHGLNILLVGASHEALVHVLTLSLHVDED